MQDINLIVTIDTEADNQWSAGVPVSTENILYWQPFQLLCEQYSIRPTYLVTSEIALDSRAVSFLKPLVESGLAEVGAHLHPWTTPPFGEEQGLTFNDPVHAFPSQLPSHLFYCKMSTLTQQITEAIGKRPTSYRAGRFGFSKRCADVLSSFGFIVDSSVTPLVSWEHLPAYRGVGGPNFRKSSLLPFKFETATGPLVEIPVSIISTVPFLNKHPKLTFYYNLIARFSVKIFKNASIYKQPLWLRPFPGMTIDHLVSAWNQIYRQEASFAVMMFHSSELMPGGSPYRPTRRSVEQLLELLGQFFGFVKQSRRRCLTLSEAGQILKDDPSLSCR